MDERGGPPRPRGRLARSGAICRAFFFAEQANQEELLAKPSELGVVCVEREGEGTCAGAQALVALAHSRAGRRREQYPIHEYKRTSTRERGESIDVGYRTESQEPSESSSSSPLAQPDRARLARTTASSPR